MTRSGPAAATRRAKPSYQDWTPAAYQLRARDWLTSHHSAGLPLRPGGRKTSITLAGFLKLREIEPDATMLVIAPLRVCRQVWRQEAAKWTEFKDLKFSLLHGPKKDERLNDDADIWLINPEGVDWLSKKYFGRSLPFYVVTIDELTKFKNAASERHKALLPRLSQVRYRWGLTGSLAPNGYMDLFGQMKILDDGAALGKYITHFRDKYFTLGWDGFSYELMPGAEARIIDRIAEYWFPMAEEDYSQLPPLNDIEHFLELESGERKTYDKMKRDMIAALPDGIVTAANSAACYSKLSQMANGACYVGDQKQKVSHIHDLKLDAIEDLLEELNGEPLLVAYEFNHDLDRLRERFGVVDPATGRKVIPYLGKGTTAAQEAAWIAAWNRGELPLLCAHPASAGHGLNMQGASACNVAWFGITWDYELYDQFIRRIWRDGTKAGQVFNHLLLVKNTIDELKLAALRGKDMTQSGLLRALNTEIRRTGETQPGGVLPEKRSEPVVMKLSRGPAAEATPQTEAPAKPAIKGWGNKTASSASQEAAPDQRERIAEQLQAGEGRAVNARSAFSGKVADAQARVQDNANDGVITDKETDAVPAKTTRTRRTADKETAEPSAAAPVIHNTHSVTTPDTSIARMIAVRVELLKLAAPMADTMEEAMEAADAMWKWAANPDSLPAF